MRVFFALTSSVAMVLASSQLVLADTYHVLDIRDLQYEGDQEEISEALKHSVGSRWGVSSRILNYTNIRVPENVEVYWAEVVDENADTDWAPQGDIQVAFRLKDQKPVRGFVDLETYDATRTPYAFVFDQKGNKATDAATFEKVRKAHFLRLSSKHLPGSAWFRHRAGPLKPRTEWQRARDTGFDGTFALMSGGRAISENLALDRALILGENVEGDLTPVSEIRGVTVAPINWKERMPAGEVEIDPLAHAIPHDQHALFAPSLDALFKLLEVVEEEGAPVLQAFSVRNPFRVLPTRYRKQLGLDVPQAGSQLLPIKSVALTGGDPFFPSGTDVAVLFESENPELLFGTLTALIGAKAKAHSANAVSPSGSIKYSYQGFQSADRSFSSHVMRAGSLVAVANSYAQVEALGAVIEKRTPSLGGTDEFAFFRHRYPVADEESAFLFLSDATIRRWASPRVRIGASRRARATTVLAELTSQYLDKKSLNNDYQKLIGDVRVVDGKVFSEKFGSLHFVTPVSELVIDKATKGEVEAYERWRRGYEQGWSTVFDPIALRLNLGKKERKIDLSVLPLTVDSEYRELIEIAGESKLSAKAVNPHPEALFFGAFAVDSTHETFHEFDSEISHMLPGVKSKPLAWLGESISVFLDRDYFWEAMLSMEDPDAFLISNFSKIPIGIRMESKSSVKLALFITALKSLAETAAPDLLRWEIRKHGDRSYVAVIGDEMGADQTLTIYYAALPTAWIITLNEGMIQRAIDRELEKGQKLPNSAPKHGLVRTSPQMLNSLACFAGERSLETRRQLESWRALPILNAWHRMFPQQDPAAFHMKSFASDIVCPGGKGYRWNAKAMTMESVAYGHPAAPKDEALELAYLNQYAEFSAGLDFEDDGLRLRASLTQTEPKQSTKEKVKEAKLLSTCEELTVTKPGAKWKYSMRGAGDGVDFSETTLVSVEEKDGQEVLTESVKYAYSDGEKETAEGVYKLDENGSHLLRYRGGDHKIVYTAPMMVMPAELRLNQAAVSKAMSVSTIDDEDEKSIEWNIMKPVGVEEVVVPAGTFTDCVRIESVFISATEEEYSEAKFTYWFKAGVGMVKSIESYHGEDYVTELTEVYIP